MKNSKNFLDDTIILDKSIVKVNFLAKFLVFIIISRIEYFILD